MAFDFHLCADFDARTTTLPACQLEEELHERLFAWLGSRAEAYPLLMESAQFSHDSFYEPDDLPDLILELAAAARELEADASLVSKLGELGGVCGQALERGLRLHGVAD